jgi:hypothetical protein
MTANLCTKSSILTRCRLGSIAALTLLVAGCGGDSGSESSASRGATGLPATSISDSAPSSDGGAGSDTSGSGEGNEIDACSLIPDADATAVLGEAFDAKTPTSGSGGGSECEWHTASEYSITLEVGGSGTAPGNKLELDPILGEPKPIDALGDQGALMPGGVVYFAAGNRLNYLQVVSKTAGGADGQGATELAVKLASQIAAAS